MTERKKRKKFKFYVTIKQDYEVMSKLFKFWGKSECVNIIISGNKISESWQWIASLYNFIIILVMNQLQIQVPMPV